MSRKTALSVLANLLIVALVLGGIAVAQGPSGDTDSDGAAPYGQTPGTAIGFYTRGSGDSDMAQLAAVEGSRSDRSLPPTWLGMGGLVMAAVA